MSNGKRILVVDDEDDVKQPLCQALIARQYDVDQARDGMSALQLIEQFNYDLVISDVRMPDLNGLELLDRAKRLDSSLGFIMITGHAKIPDAVEAMRKGAHDYITKPFTSQEMETIVAKYFEYRSLVDENIYLKSELKMKYSFGQIIGKSKALQDIFETIKLIASSKVTVLIHGESGTGKELIAKAIHYNSNRAKKKFIAQNCGALPESLLESELFGHKKGAFTGALENKIGLFEAADRGTLFLDEISEAPTAVQVRLLRVLQEGEIRRVGENETRSVDVRVIASTNTDLEARVREKLFREDLFFRLNVVPLRVPSLRERLEDIPLLANHFLKIYCRENNKVITDIDEDVVARMMEYDWPGNVRELENMVNHAVAICRGKVLTLDHFQQLKQKTVSVPVLVSHNGGKTLDQIEREVIIAALRRNEFNRTRAAVELGVNVRTIRNKIRRYKGEGHLQDDKYAED